jgi:hypothetical protein
MADPGIDWAAAGMTAASAPSPIGTIAAKIMRRRKPRPSAGRITPAMSAPSRSTPSSTTGNTRPRL